MEFVDRNGRFRSLPFAACGEPRIVMPAIIAELRHYRCGTGWRFGLSRDRVGLPRQLNAAAADNVVFVARAGRDPWHEKLPDAGTVAYAHGMAAPSPGIEIADDGAAFGIRRPHRKTDAADAVDGESLRSQTARQFEMPAFVEKVQIDIADQQPERVGVFGLLHRI